MAVATSTTFLHVRYDRLIEHTKQSSPFVKKYSMFSFKKQQHQSDKGLSATETITECNIPPRVTFNNFTTTFSDLPSLCVETMAAKREYIRHSLRFSVPWHFWKLEKYLSTPFLLRFFHQYDS